MDLHRVPSPTRSPDSLMGTSDHFRSLADNFVADLAAQKSRARQLHCLLKVAGREEHALCAVRILAERLCLITEVKTVHLSDQCMRLCLIHLAGSLWISKELDEIIATFLLSPIVAECLQQNFGVILGDVYDDPLTDIKWAALLSLCSIETTSVTTFTSIAVHRAVAELRKMSDLFEAANLGQFNHEASNSFWCLQCILSTLSAVLMVSNPKFYLCVEQCQLLPSLAKLLSILTSKNSILDGDLSDALRLYQLFSSLIASLIERILQEAPNLAPQFSMSEVILKLSCPFWHVQYVSLALLRAHIVEEGCTSKGGDPVEKPSDRKDMLKRGKFFDKIGAARPNSGNAMPGDNSDALLRSVTLRRRSVLEQRLSASDRIAVEEGSKNRVVLPSRRQSIGVTHVTDRALAAPALTRRGSVSKSKSFMTSMRVAKLMSTTNISVSPCSTELCQSGALKTVCLLLTHEKRDIRFLACEILQKLASTNRMHASEAARNNLWASVFEQGLVTILEIISVGFYVPCGVFSIPQGVESIDPQSTVVGDTFENQPFILCEQVPSVILFPEQAIRATTEVFLRDMVEGLIFEDEVFQNNTTSRALHTNAMNSDNGTIRDTGEASCCDQCDISIGISNSSSSYRRNGSEVKESTDFNVLHRLIADLQYEGCTNLKINIMAGLFQLAAQCPHFGRLVWSSRLKADISDMGEYGVIFVHLFSSSKASIGRDALKALVDLMVINISDASPVRDRWEKNGRFQFPSQEEGGERILGKECERQSINQSVTSAAVEKSLPPSASDVEAVPLTCIEKLTCIQHESEAATSSTLSPSPSLITKRANPKALVRDDSGSDHPTHQTRERYWAKIACPPLSVIMTHSAELAKLLMDRPIQPSRKEERTPTRNNGTQDVPNVQGIRRTGIGDESGEGTNTEHALVRVGSDEENDYPVLEGSFSVWQEVFTHMLDDSILRSAIRRISDICVIRCYQISRAFNMYALSQEYSTVLQSRLRIENFHSVMHTAMGHCEACPSSFSPTPEVPPTLRPAKCGGVSSELEASIGRNNLHLSFCRGCLAFLRNNFSELMKMREKSCIKNESIYFNSPSPRRIMEIEDTPRLLLEMMGRICFLTDEKLLK